MALYLAKKNASKTANQKVGADKDDTSKKSIGKLGLNSKKLKKSGALVKEVIICYQRLPNLAYWYSVGILVSDGFLYSKFELDG